MNNLIRTRMSTNKKYLTYFSLLAVVIVGIVSILGSGGGGSSTPPPPGAPYVTTVTPADTSDTALVTSVITAQFSERMDPNTINNPDTSANLLPNSFVVSDGSGQIHGSVEFFGTYQGHDNVAVFTPNDDLDVNGTYSAIITTDVTNTSGTPLASAYPWSFRTAPAQTLFSTDSSGSVGSSGVVITSPSDIDETGEYIVFASTDSLLAGIPTVPAAQIYRKNTITGQTEIVSIGGIDGNQLANGACETPRISDTGRFVVFACTATTLDPTITVPPTGSHIYLKDMKNGDITLLDRHHTDTFKTGNGESFRPDISGTPKDDPQGRYVVFDSKATDLVDGDSGANGLSDIFLVSPGSIERISVSLDPTFDYRAEGPSYRPRITDNGRRIVFESDAPNLVTGDINAVRDIFLRIRNNTNPPSGTTIRLSLADSTNAEADAPSSNADISSDGNYVAFQSAATNLVSGDGISRTDIFLREISTDTTTWLSANTAANEANGDSTLPSINDDGSYVTFESSATDLVLPNSNSFTHIYVKDTSSGALKQLSVDNPVAATPTQANNNSSIPAISTNGRYISFSSLATNLDSDDTNGGQPDIYRAYNAALP